MRPLTNRTGAQFAAAITLLTAAIAGCAFPVSAVGSRTLGSPTAMSISSPRYITGPLPTEPTGPVPVVKGCPSGTVAITHYPGDPGKSTACITAGSRLQLTFPNGKWGPMHVTPVGAATLASTTDSAGTTHTTVTPVGTAPFCLSTVLGPASPTAAITLWQLCVTIQR